MAPKVVLVLLGDDVVGTLEQLPNGKVRLVYEGEPTTPLSVSMPAQRKEHNDRVASPWLWGLLPDNEQVLSRWSRQFQVSASSVFALLSTPVGEDCPGAVRLVRPERLDEVSSLADERTGTDWLDERQIAQRLRELRADHTSWLGAGFAGRFSLAGAQAKTALLRDGDRWGDPHGAGATTHILKPAIAGLDEHDLNEHLCLRALGNLGLPVVATRVERFEDQSAIVVTRYDRRRDRDERLRRIHQEDVCQALGIHPRSKYQNEGGPGPAEVAALFRRTMPAAAAARATRQFLDALLVNWLIAGTDAHAKNYSLLLSGSQVRFAPLYDVASALPYGTAEQKLRLAMKFGSGYRLDPASSPWARLAKDTGLTEGAVRARAAELADAVAGAFERAAADPAVVALGSRLPQRLVELVGDRSARCRKLAA